MESLKKSFNLSADIAQKVDEFIQANPGVSFTLVMHQALLKWLQNPELALKIPGKKMNEDEIRRFMKENSGLMDDLAK